MKKHLHRYTMLVALFTSLFALQVQAQNGTEPTSFANKTTADGLGNNYLYGVCAVGSNIYAATLAGGVGISTDGGTTFTKTTTTNGLGDNSVLGVYAVGNNVYAATNSGVSISTNGGASFTNKTKSNGLGGNTVKGVYAVGDNIYAATTAGLSISTNGGTSFTNKTTTNGLGSNYVNGVYAVGNTIYAATTGGLSISTDGGTTFTNKTTADGLGYNSLYGVYVVGSTIYVATANGVSISTNGGTSFTNKTTASGLGASGVYGVYVIGTTVYAATSGGLSISTNGGNSFTNKTTANGLGSSSVNGVYALGNTVYAATTSGLSIGVGLQTPTITTAPSASDIYYGQTLASSTLSGGVASVAGTFAFTTPTTAPGAGTASQGYTFTPTDASNYKSVTGTVSVKVNKATPIISAHADISATYKDGVAYTAVSTSNSTGGKNYFSNNTNVATVNANTGYVSIVGAGSTTITVNQYANTNYLAGTATINVTVAKAAPSITTAPTASDIYYGQTLASSTLSGGVASVAGTFAFTTPSTVPGMGTASQGYTFTPTDASNYKSVTGTVSVSVNEMQMPVITTQPSDVSVVEGDNASFTVGVTGTPSPTLQWQFKMGGDWTDASGFTSAIALIPGIIVFDGIQLRAVVTNAAGSVTSNAVTLTVKPACTPTTSTQTVNACGSYTWNGTNYTASGTYTYTTKNADGCDSVATLHLTIKQTSTSSLSVNACTSYTWHGNTYTASGAYTYTTTNAIGCDSIVTLNLHLKSATDVFSISGTTNSCVSGKTTQLYSNFAGGTWASSLGNVTVDNNGLVTGNGATNALATIKYYCLTDSASTTFSYLPFTVIGSKPIIVPASVCSGSTVQLQTNVLTYPQNVLNNTTGAWSVQNPLRATIDQNGVLTGGTPGGHPIVTYTLTNKLGCVRNLYDTTITVNATPTTKPTISGATAVCTQSTVQLSATPGGASNTWGIQNPIRGSISNTGLLTGASPSANAIVTYKYTDANGCSSATAYYNVYVNASTASPRITTLSGTYCVGSSYNFAATPVGGTWSTNNAIASITSSSTSASTAKINSAGSFGIIYKTAADVNGCKATTTFIRSTSNCTSSNVVLDTLQHTAESARVQSASVSVYPNPARGVVTLNSPSVDANSSFSIADITGKVVMVQAISDKQTKVNISGLKSGIYFISIQSAEGKTTKKLIINN